MNPKDPILKSGPDQQRELFERFCKEANGFSTEDVIGAAMNLLVNGIRQAHPQRDRAQQAMDERFAKSKELLDQHYDASGRKRGIFPFHQIVHIPHFTDRDGAR